MNIEKWQSQIRKGTLEFIILLTLRKEEFYGYELIKKIKSTVEIETSEGTIYPILTRLKTLGYVTTRWDNPESGMPRKYYKITNEGNKMLSVMTAEWKSYSGSINRLIED